MSLLAKMPVAATWASSRAITTPSRFGRRTRRILDYWSQLYSTVVVLLQLADQVLDRQGVFNGLLMEDLLRLQSRVVVEGMQKEEKPCKELDLNAFSCKCFHFGIDILWVPRASTFPVDDSCVNALHVLG